MIRVTTIMRGAAIMEMTSLRKLHQSMLRERVDMQQFRIRMGAAEFDCLFSTRDAPFVLSLTSRGANPKFFKFDVLPGYRIKTFLGKMYGDLRSVLFVDGSSGHRLDPQEFFAQLNGQIPTEAKAGAIPSPDEVVRFRRDLLECERPYFDQWGLRGSGPSPENKLKTLIAIGPEALAFSIEINKSSIWSATPTGRSWR
jgi:hypothetical protein